MPVPEDDRSPVEILNGWATVSISEEGTDKYVLIEAYATETIPGDPPEEKETSKLIVQGYNWAEYHADIYDSAEEKLRQKGLDAQCLGGGRIVHKPEEKYIKVYGYSVGFGRADHTKTVEVLTAHYPEYKIEWSNEGY
jgi:phosphohistidine phosphatase